VRRQPVQTMADLIPPQIRWAVISAADDDLTKIARLKEQGILSEAEFNQMKQEILRDFKLF
jgi:Short C-terminal domain